jgi:prepilin-type N-terminal cleavage/methylation domain-containing protein
MIFRRPARSLGFTLVEVLVAMTLTGIVVAGTLRALTAQRKFYARQARILEARHAMRASVTILGSELREASATGGDLYAVAADSLALRSTAGFAIVCNVNTGAGSFSVTHVSGHFRLDGADSVLVFVENTVVDGDDSWRAFPVTNISTSGPACANGGAADRVISVTGNLSGIWAGAPLRLFRPYVFALFELEGRWWLGRRNRGSGPSYIPVAGPLAPPGDNGLVLTYYRQDGGTTLTPGLVSRVDIAVRAPTFRSATDPAYRDLSTTTYLRNDD